MRSISSGLTILSELQALKHEFVTNRALWIPSSRMLHICRALGASTRDFDSIKTVSDTLKTDPTLPFRRSKNGRFAFDFNKREIRRLEHQPFILSAEEDFVRHDSGQVRKFEDVDAPLQYNSVLHALFRFKCFMMQSVAHKPRARLNYNSPTTICTLFNLRTVTDERADLIGQPALEGVHSDGVDFTMTTLLGHTNMQQEGSAETFLHSLAERSGIRWDEVDPAHSLGRVQHLDLLDTLLIADHERKHSLSPVYAQDKDSPALRDMLIFFSRKPVVEGHVSYEFDSLNEHRELPLKLGMFEDQEEVGRQRNGGYPTIHLASMPNGMQRGFEARL